MVCGHAFPAGQTVQVAAVLPGSAYVPGEHLKFPEPLFRGQDHPAGHVVQLVLPAKEKEPGATQIVVGATVFEVQA